MLLIATVSYYVGGYIGMKLHAASHLLSRFRKKRRGSTLAIAIATIMVFLVVVIALHYQQNSARASLNRAEAELRFREGRNFALRQHLFTDKPIPGDLLMDVSIVEQEPEDGEPAGGSIEKLYARTLFERTGGTWSGLPNLKTTDRARAHNYLEFKVGGLGGLKNGLHTGSYKMVETEVPGYAAYAPKGSITSSGEVAGWQNPDQPKEGESSVDSTEAFSGVPAVLAALKDITVEEMAYGDAYTIEGEIEIPEGAGVGFKGDLPLPAYEGALMAELDSARGSLEGAASNGNKTSLLNQGFGLADLIGILFGGSFAPEQLLSLRQAWSFPVPMLPGFSMTAPPLVYEIWFHVPFQPDLGFSSSGSPDVERMEELAEERKAAEALLIEADAELKQAEQAQQAAQAAYNANPNPANEELLVAANAALEDARDTVEEIGESIKETSEEAGAIASDLAGQGMMDTPERRADDPSGREGQYGWNYSKVMGKFFGLVKALVLDGGNAQAIADSVSENVRMVHYGPESNPTFTFDDGTFRWDGDKFVSKSTWTVPSSRTLRYDGNMEIQGDLWLQRGTVMTVNGNLKVAAPGAVSVTDGSAPSGRVFFEEGSTLIVNGDFECEGSRSFGSIMVGGEPNEIHPITSALLVSGTATIPHGTTAGHTLPDLIAALGLPGTAEGASTVAMLLEQQAPLLSKLAGPFHLRNCFYAKYATTFQLVVVPFPPAIVITPIPTPTENLWVFAFRAKTLAYTAALNATLGENLYTQSDWWPFGTGVVPMSLNLNLGAALQSAGKAEDLLNSAELDPAKIEEKLEGFVDKMLARTVDWVIEKVKSEIVDQAIGLLPGGIGTAVNAAKGFVEEFDDGENEADNIYEEFVDDFQGQMGQHGRDLLGDLLAKTNISDADEYLKEYAGLLIQAETINIGDDARQVCGMLVARRDINSEADLTIGTMMALEGDIRVKDFLYYPYFNQASLYLPKAIEGANAIEKAMVREYGDANDSGLAVQVGPPQVSNMTTSGGWEL